MFDRLFRATVLLQLSRDIQTSLILTGSTNKAFVSIVKLFALALDQAEIVPDARISLGDLCRALQQAVGTLVIAVFVKQKTEIVQVLRIVFIERDGHLERSER